MVSLNWIAKILLILHLKASIGWIFKQGRLRESIQANDWRQRNKPLNNGIKTKSHTVETVLLQESTRFFLIKGHAKTYFSLGQTRARTETEEISITSHFFGVSLSLEWRIIDSTVTVVLHESNSFSRNGERFSLKIKPKQVTKWKSWCSQNKVGWLLENHVFMSFTKNDTHNLPWLIDLSFLCLSNRPFGTQRRAIQNAWFRSNHRHR